MTWLRRFGAFVHPRVEPGLFRLDLISAQAPGTSLLARSLPKGNLGADRSHLLDELPMCEDVGVVLGRILIIERLGKIILGEPFAVIFDEIVDVKPVPGRVAPAT